MVKKFLKKGGLAVLGVKLTESIEEKMGYVGKG